MKSKPKHGIAIIITPAQKLSAFKSGSKDVFGRLKKKPSKKRYKATLK